MTQDYKDELLKYITINTDYIGVGDNIPSFSDAILESSTVFSELSSELGYYEIRGTIKCKNNNGDYNGFTLIYGWFDNQAPKGFIAILNEKYEIIKIIKKFDSNENLRIFQTLNVDEKGQIYGIDRNGDSDLTGRFIMLNNISVKSPSTNDYIVHLRRSYFLQGNLDGRANTIDNIYKQYNGSNYYISMNSGNGTSLKINVGEENVWTDFTWTIDSSISGASVVNIKRQVLWDEDENINITELMQVKKSNSNIDKIFLGINDENNVIVFTELYDIVSDLFNNENGITIYEGSDAYHNGCMTANILNSTKFQITIPYSKYENNVRTIGAKTIDYNNGTTTTIYNFTYDGSADSDVSKTNFVSEAYFINNTLFNLHFVCGNNEGQNAYCSAYVVILLAQNKSSSKKLGEVNLSYPIFIADITNMYNLYITNLISIDKNTGQYTYFKSNMIYNIDNYNGIPREIYNMLSPNQVFLYDNDDNIIFARNLYNRTLLENTTESTVQVPNTMLNDIILSTQKLVGKSNYILNENTEDIEKNIYETLYINFFNTINVVNKIEPNNPIYNKRMASMISYYLSEGEFGDQDLINIHALRINYKNGTYKITHFISNTITNGVAEMKFIFTVLDDILNIQIVSGASSDDFITITDVDNYEIGKTYNLSVKCYIE